MYNHAPAAHLFLVHIAHNDRQGIAARVEILFRTHTEATNRLLGVKVAGCPNYWQMGFLLGFRIRPTERPALLNRVKTVPRWGER